MKYFLIKKSLFLFLLALICATNIRASDYPTKPIRHLVGAVGTPVDILARILADKLSAQLGQAIFVENKTGVANTLAAQEVLRLPADGYNMITINMPMSIGQTIIPNISYQLQKDFAPVGQFAWSYNILVVHPSVKANTPKDLAELIRANPDAYSFASGGAGTPAHLTGELFKLQTQTKALHVPYAQYSQAILDLMGGRTQFMFGAAPSLIPQIQSGKLKALAVTGPNRIAAIKDIPTMTEAGFTDFIVRDWQGIVMKADTAPEIILLVNRALNKVLEQPEVIQSFAKAGADIARGSPEDFGLLIRSEISRWEKVAKSTNLTIK